MLDGVDNNTFSTNTIEDTQLVVRPSIDAVEEFRVITSRTAPSTVEVQARRSPPTVKEVRIVFMVSVYEIRAEIAHSTPIPFLPNRAGLDQPRKQSESVRRHGGGPIVSNKLFWLIDYEGTRTRQGILRQTSVPLPNERAGEFFVRHGWRIRCRFTPSSMTQHKCAVPETGSRSTAWTHVL